MTKKAENESILKTLGLPDVDIRDIHDISTQDKPNKCPACCGTGKNKKALGLNVCHECRGVGYDLKDPIHVILWMSNCLQFAKKRIIQQRLEIKSLNSSEGDAQQKFYEGRRLKD